MPDGSTHDIEQRVRMNRDALAHSLDALSNTLAPERLKEEAAATADYYSTEIGQQIWKGARDNPAAFSLVAAGIALLISGAGKRGGQSAVEEARSRQTGTYERQHQPLKRGATRRLYATAQNRGGNDQARHMKAALYKGLDKLSPKARSRIIAAREAAIDAQYKLERKGRKARNAALSAVHEQPVTVAAAAFGIGALAAALAPSTRTEDAYLGAHRDALMDAAADAFKEELAKLKEATLDPPRTATAQEVGYN